jgi:hypothetical protein
MRAELNQRPLAHLPADEWVEFDEAMTELRVLANSIMSLFEAGDSANLLAFDLGLIAKAVRRAQRAQLNLRRAIDDLGAARDEGEAAKSFTKEKKKSDKGAAKRKGGTDGIWDRDFTAQELADWIAAKIERVMNGKNVFDCAQYIEVHKGSGGGTSTYFNGLHVFHISHGFSESDDGCTVFFTHAADGTITIVGIGSHDNHYTTAYRLDWQQDGWSGRKWKGKTLIFKD